MSDTHRIWINDYKIGPRLEKGYRFVRDDTGNCITRGGDGSFTGAIRQVLMHIPQQEYEAIPPTPVLFDTGYNSRIAHGNGVNPFSQRPFSQKNEGDPVKLIPESPDSDPDGWYHWTWSKTHPLFAWVPPGYALRGFSNWYWGKRMFRLVIRPNADRSLYIRICLKPWRFDFVPESRAQFMEKWH